MEFRAKLLGEFELVIDGKSVVFEANKPTKTNLMLQYLLYQRDKGVSKEQLLDMFFDSDDIVNPENNLKVNMHRLRKQLKGALGGDIDIIEVSKSNYHFNKDILIHIDFEEFNNALQMYKAEKDVEEKIEWLKRATNIYDGELLPFLNTMPNIAYANMDCKERFIDAVLDLVDLREDENSLQENIELINKAIHIYPYDDELYVVKMRLLIDGKRYKDAVSFYTETTNFFMENLGVEVLPNLKTEYQRMNASASNRIADIVDVRNEIKEIEPRHAYYCNYLSFIDNFHIINRIMSRMGRSVYLILCSINLPQSSEDLEREGACLKEGIKNSLRSGDIFTRYNTNQYLILLCNIQQENMNLVTKRIQDYMKKNTKANLDVIEFSYISAFDE